MLKRTVLISSALLLCVTVFAQSKKIKSPVEGKIFSITLTPQNEKKAEPIKDETSFAGDKQKSSFMMQAGFLVADLEYTVDSTSGKAIVNFTSESKNENQERFSWEGSVDDDTITGTVTIRKKGKIERSFTFTGVQKNKKKPKPQPKPAPTPATKGDSTKTGQ